MLFPSIKVYLNPYPHNLAGYSGECCYKEVGEPDCGSTELSLLSIFGRLISLLYLHYGVQSGATPTGCSQLYCAAEKPLLKPRPPLELV